MSETIQNSEMRSRLFAALDLMDFGIRMMRQNIVRQLPGASPELIEAEYRRWMFEQPADFQIGVPSNLTK